MKYETGVESHGRHERRPEGGRITRTLTISELEQESGVPRSKIYFYIREGVLAAPARTAQGRFLFTDDHVRLLKRVEELKAAGCTLDDVKTRLDSELRASERESEDLAAQQSERVRRDILRVATQEFVAKGYRRTNIRTVISQAGVTPQVFYSLFPSKSRLLVECFSTYLGWSMAQTGPKALATQDLGERLLLRVSADPRARAFEAEVLTLVRSATDEDAAEQAGLVQQAWAGIVRNIVADLQGVRPEGAGPPATSLELLAYGLIGALHNATLRASWGEDFDRADVMRAHLWLYLAVLAALRGECDVDGQVERYEDLIRKFAGEEPKVPSPPED